jgi:hypothetical protein
MHILMGLEKHADVEVFHMQQVADLIPVPKMQPLALTL